MTQHKSREQCQGILLKLQEEISTIIVRISTPIKDKNIFPIDIQEEIGRQIKVLEDFEDYISRDYNKLCNNIHKCNHLKSKLSYFKIAFDAILYEPPKIIIAKKIRYEIEYFLNSKRYWLLYGSTKNFFKRAAREFLTPTKVLLGLAMAIPIYGVGIPLFLTSATILTTVPSVIQLGGHQLLKKWGVDPQPDTKSNTLLKTIDKLVILSESSSLLITVAFAGAFGSIISIFIRLDQYKDPDPKYHGSAIPILIGFAKPLIGTSFGILIFAMINSNIISFPFLQESTNSTSSSNSTPSSDIQKNVNNTANANAKFFLFFTVAFLVGFSERLANDIIKRAEASLSLQEVAEQFDKTEQNLKENTEQVAQEVTSKVEEAAQSLKENTEKTAQHVTSKVESTGQEIEDKIDETEQEIKEEVRKTSDKGHL